MSQPLRTKVRIKLARVEVFTGHKPDLCEARIFWSICRRGCRETPVQEPSRSNHPRLFRAALDALEGILNDIGLSDTSVLNERITENRSCRVRRIIFGGQPISTTRSSGM